jgi:hypothetical protein
MSGAIAVRLQINAYIVFMFGGPMTYFAPALHSVSPYEDFPIDNYDLKLWGWASDHPIFEKVLSQLKPRRVIEVGSWLGGSAIHMAGLAKSIGIPDFELLCVDTWLGADEHWLNPEWFATLAVKNGYPTLYYQFLANVIHKGHQDVICPFPASAESAFHVLRAKGLEADAAYIDAGHRYNDAKSDITNYWKLIRKGGVMFGDDFTTMFPGVIRAVDEFADLNGLKVQQFNGKWLIQKL